MRKGGRGAAGDWLAGVRLDGEVLDVVPGQRLLRVMYRRGLHELLQRQRTHTRGLRQPPTVSRKAALRAVGGHPRLHIPRRQAARGAAAARRHRACQWRGRLRLRRRDGGGAYASGSVPHGLRPRGPQRLPRHARRICRIREPFPFRGRDIRRRHAARLGLRHGQGGDCRRADTAGGGDRARRADGRDGRQGARTAAGSRGTARHR